VFINQQMATRNPFTKHLSWMLCLLILFLLWILFFWRFLTPNIIDQLRFAQGDFTLHYFAFADYQVEQILSGNLFPLWNPYNYGGDPFMGNIQWATWYPLRFITALLAGEQGLTIFLYQFEVILHYLIISITMFAFLTQLVKRYESALIGAILYTYGGYLAGYPMLQPSVLAAVAWTPLVMLGIQIAFHSSKWQYSGIALGSLGVALSLLGGHPQTSMYLIYMAGAYWLFLGWQKRKSITFIGGGGILLFGLGGGMAMMQLLPSIEFTMLSARVQDLFFDAKSNGFFAHEFFQVLYPLIISQWSPLYLGIVGLLATLGALLHFQKAYRFWLGVIFVGVFLSLGGNSVVFDAFYLVVPGFSTFRQQERIISIAVFAIVILATYRIDQFLLREMVFDTKERIVVFGLTIITVTLAFVVSIFNVIDPAMSYQLPIRGAEVTSLGILREVMSLVALISLLYSLWYVWQSKRQQPTWLLAVPLVALVVFDIFTFNTRYSINFVPNEPQYITQEPEYLDLLRRDITDIQWRIDGGASLQGHGTFWRIPDMYGTGPFELSTTERLLHIGVDKRWELFAVRYITQPDGSEPPEYIPTEVIGDGTNYFGQPYTLYELMNPRPMAHLLYDVRYPDAIGQNIEETRKIIRDIVNGPINLRETAVVAKPLGFELSGERPTSAQVSSFSYITADKLEVRVNTPERAILNISVPTYPAWQATVNGNIVDIIELYGGLIGIPLEAGNDQHIEVTFVSNTASIGSALSLGSGLVVLLLLGGSIIRRIVSTNNDSTLLDE
jgi:hypothetical protein